jgi:phosphoenolpyruvate synthase/pyruvate phosphate dikinase
MTFVVLLAGGIVERRGGVLIHGAIIAREYGIPCVTGVPDATKLILTGDQLTVFWDLLSFLRKAEQTDPHNEISPLHHEGKVHAKHTGISASRFL